MKERLVHMNMANAEGKLIVSRAADVDIPDAVTKINLTIRKQGIAAADGSTSIVVSFTKVPPAEASGSTNTWLCTCKFGAREFASLHISPDTPSSAPSKTEILANIRTVTRTITKLGYPPGLIRFIYGCSRRLRKQTIDRFIGQIPTFPKK